MPVFRHELIWDIGPSSISESYYVEDADLTSAKKTIDALLPYRLKLSSSNVEFPVRIVGIRSQQVDPTLGPVDVQLVRLEGTFQVAEEKPDMPWTGVLVKMQGTGGARRTITLRALPDVIVEDYFNTPVARNAWIKAFQDYRGALIALGFRLQRITVGPANPLIQIQNITANANSTITITTASAHGLTTGEYIRFHRVKATACIQGERQVVVNDADTFTVAGFNYGTIGFIQGAFRKLAFTYEAVVSVQLGRKATRKAGRPFFSLRGRLKRCRH